MLKWIKRILLLLVVLVAVLSGLKFCFDNEQAVELLLFGWQLPSLPLGLWVLSVLFLGSLLGWVLSYLPNALNRRSLIIKDNKIEHLEEQLKKAHEDSKS